jgi:hypothetical protein
MKKITFISTTKILVFVVASFSLFSCKKSYTTCDCADLTFELYKEYDKIIFSDNKILRKALDMRKAKKALKKDERYKFCREQKVRPLSIIHYPKNKNIFATCDSWTKMEAEMDLLWQKIKDKIRGVDNDKEEEEEE